MSLKIIIKKKTKNIMIICLNKITTRIIICNKVNLIPNKFSSINLNKNKSKSKNKNKMNNTATTKCNKAMGTNLQLNVNLLNKINNKCSTLNLNNKIYHYSKLLRKLA